jgi:CspA family cold shock protein
MKMPSDPTFLSEALGFSSKQFIRPTSRSCRKLKKYTSKGSDMSTGTVKWFNAKKGFGFIQPDDGSKDAYVHVSAVERSGIGEIHEGQKLEFELVTDPGTGKTSADRLSVPV